MLSQLAPSSRKNPVPESSRCPPRVAVIGGGIAGLIVAYRRMLAGDRVTLFESSARLGGQLWTDSKDGFVVEHGAEGFARSSPALAALARELDIPHQIVEQSVHRSYGYDGRELALLEPGEAPVRLGLRAVRDPRGHGIASFRGGMGELVAALAEKIRGRVAVRLNEPVWQLLPSGSCWELGTGSFERVRVESVVLATGARVAGRLLRQAMGEPSGLEQAQVLSSATVSLAYPRAALTRELDATGFVVAESVAFDGCRACTFSSAKLPARSPEDQALLRLFFRPPPVELETLSDSAWTERAARAVRRALGVSGDPTHAWVDRWPDALAVVDARQRARVAILERRLQSRGILLAGGAFHGTGVESALRSGEIAAAALGAVG
jgi:oxygen-dependent protoporphyrinogen oxidase